MINITGIDHVVIRVQDVDRMMRFYCDLLNCRLERSEESLGLYQLRAGSALIDLVDVEGKLGRQGGAAPGPEAHNMDHLCLTVDPFDPRALAARLEAAGVTVEPPARRYGAGGFGPSIYLSDPEGNRLELKGPSGDAQDG